MSWQERAARDIGITLLALFALLAWDFSGGDIAAARFFGSAIGFAWRENFWASRVVHDGGRALAWLLLAALAWVALRPPATGPQRSERWWWIAIILFCMLVVPGLKRFSHTSCPWDLQEFGGVAQYVSHWRFGLHDGGSGRCFPSGHAVTAFGYLGLYFMWRGHDPKRARLWLTGALAMGTVFGLAQLARGAHYPSHTLWSAWLCWVVSMAAATAMAARRSAPAAT